MIFNKIPIDILKIIRYEKYKLDHYKKFEKCINEMNRIKYFMNITLIRKEIMYISPCNLFVTKKGKILIVKISREILYMSSMYYHPT